MTALGAQIAASTADRDALRDWERLRESGDLQFAPIDPPAPPETPGWLRSLGEFLQDLLEPLGKWLGVSWPTIQNVLIALAILLALLLLWVLVLRPLVDRMRQRRPETEAEDWAPSRASAVALLEEADRLAAEGRYGEAVHLLLQRSVHHIAQARPDWLLPASTAREIAAFEMLPARAREAFGVIAVRVERSLFALRSLDETDWREARAAYADFALAELPA